MQKSLALYGLLLSSLVGFSQDPHFSQYYASPSTVNPASTGAFVGDARMSGLYRQQWSHYGSPFVTGGIAFELKPNGFRDGQNNNTLAFGGMFLYDKTPDEVLKGQHVYGLLAYHQALDDSGHHKLGAGFMVGFNQKSLDASRLTF